MSETVGGIDSGSQWVDADSIGVIRPPVNRRPIYRIVVRVGEIQGGTVYVHFSAHGQFQLIHELGIFRRVDEILGKRRSSDARYRVRPFERSGNVVARPARSPHGIFLERTGVGIRSNGIGRSRRSPEIRVAGGDPMVRDSAMLDKIGMSDASGFRSGGRERRGIWESRNEIVVSSPLVNASEERRTSGRITVRGNVRTRVYDVGRRIVRPARADVARRPDLSVGQGDVGVRASRIPK